MSVDVKHDSPRVIGSTLSDSPQTNPGPPNSTASLSKSDFDISLRDYRNDSSPSDRNGSLDATEVVKNFGAGVVSPVSALFESKMSFVVGTGSIAGCAALLASYPVIAPAFIAAGTAFVAYKLGQTAYQLGSAETGDDVERAFRPLGEATTGLLTTGLGARAALRSAGMGEASGGVIAAVAENVKRTPEAVSKFVAQVVKDKPLDKLVDAVEALQGQLSTTAPAPQTIGRMTLPKLEGFTEVVNTPYEIALPGMHANMKCHLRIFKNATDETVVMIQYNKHSSGPYPYYCSQPTAEDIISRFRLDPNRLTWITHVDFESQFGASARIPEAMELHSFAAHHDGRLSTVDTGFLSDTQIAQLYEGLPLIKAPKVVEVTGLSTPNSASKVQLFGSRVSGNARPESDWDVVIQDEALLSRIKEFLPNEATRQRFESEEGFYPGMQQVSEQIWNRLGGNAGVERMKDIVFAALKAEHPGIEREKISLFIHLPRDASPDYWGIGLDWSTRMAEKDFQFLRERHGEELAQTLLPNEGKDAAQLIFVDRDGSRLLTRTRQTRLD